MLETSTEFQLSSVVLQSQNFGLGASKILKGEANAAAAPIPVTVAQASADDKQENLLEWVKKDNRRMLHVVYRVGDLDKTIKYAHGMDGK